jgi:hypothetical protein
MYHRVGFTAAQSGELWERWKKGEGLKSIGRAFGKPSSCIFAHLRPSGGIMPPARRRSRLALTMAEREEISRSIVEGQSVRAIARMLSRAASTVSLATAGWVGTGLRPPTSSLGSRRCAQSRASWRCMASCGRLLLESCSSTGRPSRSQAG